MKRVFFVGGLVAMFFLALAVYQFPGQGIAETQSNDLPPADAQQLWTYISKTSPYESWSFFPGKEGLYPGQSPHGAFLKLYGNDIAVNAARDGKPMPAGAILVKENYAEDEQTLMAVTPMYKVEEYNPQGGDWFWAKYGPDGSVQASGRVESCINCHASQTDFRFIEAK